MDAIAYLVIYAGLVLLVVVGVLKILRAIVRYLKS